MPPTPPLPSNAGIPSTPPTSSQRHQQAARNQERNQRHIGSPEQRRTPAISSHSSALPPLIVNGRELNHLPLDIHMQMINVPPHPPLQRRGHAPPQPFPLPPPPPPASVAFTNVSSSMAPSALGSGFIPILPLPFPPPSPPLASSSRQTLDSAQLRALYVSLPNQQTSRGRYSVSCIYLFIYLLFTNIIHN